MHLFSPLELREITLKNRIAVSPMCQYSSQDGFPNDWHSLHLGSRAVGGAGLVIVEATAVEARGRISPNDLGLWKDEHTEPLARIVRLIQEQGAVAGIQIAHAGRKASTARPWDGRVPLNESNGGWSPIVAPSALRFDDRHNTPVALDAKEIRGVIEAFASATRRAVEAGFRVLEIHGAHGYLIHQFLSPFSNQREDAYGGSFNNRVRFAEDVTRTVRSNWPEEYPLLFRISATDWAEGGWCIEQSIALAERLKPLGVDLIDCSSGGNVSDAKIPVGPGYQTPFAEAVRKGAGTLTGAVGMVTSASQADHIIRTEQADLVLLGRELLRNPYWPLLAASELGHEVAWPIQYERAKPR